MKKLIVILGIVIAVVVVGLIGMRFYTKQFSPQDSAIYESDSLSLKVTYSRPYKKGREIFGPGKLVPYDTVWRTGANEATVFESSADITINGQTLKAGKYSLFTIPGEGSWQVIFNNESGQWGVDFSNNAQRAPEQDELIATVNSIHTPDVFEQFTIDFEQMGEEIEMVLMWDQTLVVIPIVVE